MTMNLQTLDLLPEMAQTYIQKNKRQGYQTSLSGLFKHLRRLQTFSIIGDYPILSQCVTYLSVKRTDLYRVFKQSKELSQLSKKDKMTLFDNLMKPSYMQQDFTTEAN